MDETQIVLERHEQKINAIEKEISELKAVQSEIRSMNETLVTLATELKHTNEHLARHELKIEEMEGQPRARMQQIVTAIIAALAGGQADIALLPQPFVTVAQSSVEGLRVAIDLTEAWNALDNGSTLFTGVLVIRRDFAETYPEAIKAFLAEYEASTKYINENVADGAQLVEKYGIVKAAVAEKAIPYCNITYIAGEDMVVPMNGYLQVLFDQNPKSIGGAMPGEDFYYIP